MALPNIGCWAGPDGELCAHVREESQMMLEAYRIQPTNLQMDANQEEDTARGGYADRQAVELALDIADRAYVLDKGKVARAGTPHSVRDTDILTRVFLGRAAE